MTDERQKGMEATAERLRGELARVMHSLHLGEVPETIVFDLLRSRLEKVTVRGFFTHMVYEYAREQAKIEHLPLSDLADRQSLFNTQLPFLVESIMNVQYLENHILDGKNGILKAGSLDPVKVNNTLLASHLLKDFLYEYVATEVFPTEAEEMAKLSATMRKIFRFTDTGQVAEKTWASHENFRDGFAELPYLSRQSEGFIDHEMIDSWWQELSEAGVSNGMELYTRFYLRRIYLTNAGLFVLIAELICDLIGYDGEQKGNLLRFAAEFGLVSQLVNDVADFLPASYKKATGAKQPEDAFSDLRSGNITLPLIFLRSSNNNLDTAELADNIEGYEKQHVVFELVKPTCYFEIIKFLQDHAKTTHLLLNRTNICYDLLSGITDVVYNSKYFKHFKCKKQSIPTLDKRQKPHLIDPP